MRTNSDDAEFLRFAKRATAGMDTSDVMIGSYNELGKGTLQWYAFALQVGQCLMDGKPLLLVAPMGSQLPEKLRAAATAVEYYLEGNPTSLEQATKRALETVGRPVRH